MNWNNFSAGLECGNCVLQWRYIAGNNWGMCEDGTGAVGCGPQEEFRACSDISIGYLLVFIFNRKVNWEKNETNLFEINHTYFLTLLLKVNMRRLLLCDQFDQEQNQRNVPKSQMPPKARHQPMWKHSKSQYTTVHHDIWEQSSSCYQPFWLLFVCYLPFICIIITEVLLSSSCTGISNTKNHHRLICLHPNQFRSFLQRILPQHSIRRCHLHVLKDCHNHSMKWPYSNQALSVDIQDKIVTRRRIDRDSNFINNWWKISEHTDI